MHKNLSQHLVNLVKHMDKAEKRRFSLYAQRNTDRESTKFLKLFHYINKNGCFDKENFLAQNTNVRAAQLSNLKRHLYEQLLISLRQGQVESEPDIKIRQTVDYAQTLFNKGLYAQSLWMLDQAKTRARKWQRDGLLVEIVHLEKLIELHFVTGRPSSIAGKLTNKASEVLDQFKYVNHFSGLALTMYGLYMEKGYVKNTAEYEETKQLFYGRLPGYTYKELGISEQIYLHQAFFWYHYVTQNFVMCYKHAQNWVSIIKNHRLEKSLNTQYLRGLNSLLSCLFRMNYKRQFDLVFNEMKDFKATWKGKLNRNMQVMVFRYLTIHKFNKHFMEGTFAEGEQTIEETLRGIEQYKGQLEKRFIVSVYYKIASIYFGSGNFNDAARYLNKILFKEYTALRQDIHAFSRILLTVCYFEMNDQRNMAYMIRTTYHYLGRIKDLNLFQREIFKFLRKTSSIDRYQLHKDFRQLYKNMIKISETPYETRPFYYFDIISWLESKFEKRPIAEIIRERGLGHRKLFKAA